MALIDPKKGMGFYSISLEKDKISSRRCCLKGNSKIDFPDCCCCEVVVVFVDVASAVVLPTTQLGCVL
jgi:hypothetical protein